MPLRPKCALVESPARQIALRLFARAAQGAHGVCSFARVGLLVPMVMASKVRGELEAAALHCTAQLLRLLAAAAEITHLVICSVEAVRQARGVKKQSKEMVQHYRGC